MKKVVYATILGVMVLAFGFVSPAAVDVSGTSPSVEKIDGGVLGEMTTSEELLPIKRTGVFVTSCIDLSAVTIKKVQLAFNLGAADALASDPSTETTKPKDSTLSIVPPDCRGNAPVSGENACDLDDVELAALNVATIILGLSGSLALLMFVYGGFLYIFAGGNQNLAGKAKNAIVYAVIGLIIVIGARLLLSSVVGALIG